MAMEVAQGRIMGMYDDPDLAGLEVRTARRERGALVEVALRVRMTGNYGPRTDLATAWFNEPVEGLESSVNTKLQRWFRVPVLVRHRLNVLEIQGSKTAWLRGGVT